MISVRTFAVLLMASVVVGCGSGGGVTGKLPNERGEPDQKKEDPKTKDPKTRDDDKPTLWNPKLDGPKFHTAFDNGTAFSTSEDATAVLKTGSGDIYTSGVSTDIEKDDFGNLRFSTVLHGRGTPFASTTFSDADHVPGSDDAWQREWTEYTNRYSLSLWNAGKGHRDGLDKAEDGQSYHKILGYYLSSSMYGGSTQDARGHTVVGIQTDERDFKRQKTRTATYDGYYFVNAIADDRPNMGSPNELRGGIQLQADFDNQTIKGRSTDMEVNTGAGFKKHDGSIRFKQTRFDTTSAGNGYVGEIESDMKVLDGGTFKGRFYGGNANETAGTVTGRGGGFIAEGFFTASRNKTKK